MSMIVVYVLWRVPCPSGGPVKLSQHLVMMNIKKDDSEREERVNEGRRREREKPLYWDFWTKINPVTVTSLSNVFSFFHAFIFIFIVKGSLFRIWVRLLYITFLLSDAGDNNILLMLFKCSLHRKCKLLLITTVFYGSSGSFLKRLPSPCIYISQEGSQSTFPLYRNETWESACASSEPHLSISPLKVAYSYFVYL